MAMRRAVEGARWRLALWDCIPARDAWSPAYTVHSILVLLQSFLVDEDLQFDHHQVGGLQILPFTCCACCCQGLPQAFGAHLLECVTSVKAACDICMS